MGDVIVTGVKAALEYSCCKIRMEKKTGFKEESVTKA